MSQRFIRCPHCGLPHSVDEPSCPITGRPMEARRPQSRAAEAESARKLPVSEARYERSSVDVGSSAPLGGSRFGADRRPGQLGQQSAPPPAASVGSMAAHAGHASSAAPFETAAPSAPPILGQTLGGKYRAVRILGEGGMGAVYECEHIALHRRVAVKVLHPAHARKKASVARFHHEAQVAGAIGHPNICEIYDMGEADDGSPFLVMELLQGETLADRIASEGALPFDDVVEVITQVLSGLIAAHEKGIIHRDIKPENVFLTQRSGIPPLAKLLDFGISKAAGGDDLHLTRTGMVMGTPFYMSPEQARGDRTLDHRVDIYATGVMMYECLTGRRPFTAANYNALLVQILTTSARPASEIRPAMPAGFDEVVSTAMNRDRNQRFRNAAEMQRAIVALRDPGGQRRLASIPPEPVPLVTPRRDRPGEPVSTRRGRESNRELPAISVNLEGRDLMDSGSASPAQGDSGSIEIPIVDEPPSQQQPSSKRALYQPPPPSSRQPSRATPPRPMATPPVSRPAPRPAPPEAFAQKSADKSPSAPQPLPRGVRRPSRLLTPTPTSVDPRLLHLAAARAASEGGIDAPWLIDALDADPTEIGSLHDPRDMQDPTEIGPLPNRAPIDADSTERIDPARMRFDRSPRLAREVHTVHAEDPRRETDAPPPPVLPEDEQPTTLFDRRSMQPKPLLSASRPPSAEPPRASTTERAPAPQQPSGRSPSIAPATGEKASVPRPPVLPRIPRRS